MSGTRPGLPPVSSFSLSFSLPSRQLAPRLISLVTTIELETLYESYRRISSLQDRDGVIDIQEFKRAFGWEDSTVAARLFHVFDLNSDQSIDFEEFVKGLAICRSGTVEEKTRRAHLQ